MHRALLPSLAVAAMLFVGGSCSKSETPPDAPRDVRTMVSAEEMSRIQQAEKALALDLFELLRHEGPGNFAICPPSIAETLAIAYAGAGGQTAKQLAAVLHVQDLGVAHAHDALSALSGRLVQNGQGVQVEMATALWSQQRFQLTPEFLQTARKVFRAEVAEVDFEHQPAAAHERIDAWVKAHTHDKIQHLVIEPDPLARLIVTNAVYFLGNWFVPFDKAATRDEPFLTPDDGRKLPIPTMRRDGEYLYGQDDTLQVLELPYAAGGLSMFVLLPREPNGLAAIEAALPDKLDGWIDRLKETEVHVHLPRFLVSKTFDLKGPIRRLGAPLMFDAGAADFSRASTAKGLFISAIVHQVVVDVDEKGTEAAAVTGMAAEEKIATAAEPVVFRADHPFLFLIRDSRQGTILFIGRFAQPQLAPTATTNDQS